MSITLPLSSLLIIGIDTSGIILPIFVGFLLIVRNDEADQQARRLLGILLILAALTLFNDMLNTSGLTNRMPWLYFLPIYFSLSIGPLLYLFTKSKLGKLNLYGPDAWHLLVPAIQFLIYLAIGFQSTAVKSAAWNTPAFKCYLTAESILFPLFLIGYAWAAQRLIKSQAQAETFWSKDIRHWLHQFIYGILILAGLEFLYLLIEFLSHQWDWGFSWAIILHSLILSSMLLWVALNGFKLYLPSLIHPSIPPHDGSDSTNEAQQALADRIEQLMQTEHVYLNPALDLRLLAHFAGTSPKSCSQAINGILGQNFNNYINHYRIKAFKTRINAGAHQKLTLTAVAYECGFDSKATFNRVFKQVTAMTPSQYIQQQA